MATAELFEKWTEYFKSRIALLPANLVYNSDSLESTKSHKKERKRQRDQKRKAEFRKSFQPSLPSMQIPIPFGNLSIQDHTNKETLRTEDAVLDNGEEFNREELKLKLHDKIDAMKVKTGTAKLRKKTQSERRIAKMATKRKQERQIRTRKLIKKASKAQKDLPVKISNLQFTEFSTDPKQGEVEKKGKSRKRKLAKSLAKAERNKEIEKSFAETGKGGAKVLTTEWNHALQRASGGRVLDDPKKIKKTIEDKRKRKIRSAKAWEKRLENVEQQKQERQEKRRKNLKTRSDEKKRKKELRKAKKSGIAKNSF